MSRAALQPFYNKKGILALWKTYFDADFPYGYIRTSGPGGLKQGLPLLVGAGCISMFSPMLIDTPREHRRRYSLLEALENLLHESGHVVVTSLLLGIPLDDVDQNAVVSDYYKARSQAIPAYGDPAKDPTDLDAAEGYRLKNERLTQWLVLEAFRRAGIAPLKRLRALNVANAQTAFLYQIRRRNVGEFAELVDVKLFLDHAVHMLITYKKLRREASRGKQLLPVV